MKEGKKYPFQLDANGTPVKNSKNYADLVEPSGNGGFRWKQARIVDMQCSDMEPVNSWLHRCTVRGSLSVFTDTYGNLGNI